MTKFIIAIAVVVSGVILAFMYVEIEKMKQDPSRIPASVEMKDKVLLVHSFRDGIHRYFGEIKLPHSCYGVSANILQDPNDPTAARILVVTKDRMLEENFCSQFSTGYPFELVVDAPEDLHVTTFVDAKEVEHVEQKVDWQSPRGVLITPSNPKK